MFDTSSGESNQALRVGNSSVKRGMDANRCGIQVRSHLSVVLYDSPPQSTRSPNGLVQKGSVGPIELAENRVCRTGQLPCSACGRTKGKSLPRF